MLRTNCSTFRPFRSAGGAAVALTLVLTLSAPGAILWFPAQDIPIPTTFEGVSVDLETGATSTDLEGLAGGDVNFVWGGEGLTNDADVMAMVPSFQPVRSGTGNTDAIRNLMLGDTVDGSTSAYSTGFGGSQSHFPPFVSGDSGYVGFSLQLENSDVVYGWMRVTLQNDNTPGVIHEWAFERDGSAIQVGAIPEPGVGLLALLALVPALRRRRR